MDLSWNDLGDTFISKYQSRHRADGETNWTDWADIPGATTTHQVTGLTNDTTYTFELRAVRDRDNAGPSTSATATPKPPPPPAPVGLTAAPADRQIALSWNAPTPADPRISRYEYRVKRDGQSAWRPDWTEVPGSSASTTSYSVTGLLNDTTYTVEVRAVRLADTAGAESTVIIKTPKPAPRGLIARAGDGQVDLSWTDPGDDEITGYAIRRSTDGGSNWNPDWDDIDGSDQDTVAHTVSGPGGHSLRPGRPRERPSRGRQLLGDAALGQPVGLEHHHLPVPGQRRRRHELGPGLDRHRQQR